jgi:hypothetical protein
MRIFCLTLFFCLVFGANGGRVFGQCYVFGTSPAQNCDTFLSSHGYPTFDIPCGGCDSNDVCSSPSGFEYVEGSLASSPPIIPVTRPGITPILANSDACGYIVSCANNCAPVFSGTGFSMKCVRTLGPVIGMPYLTVACSVDNEEE